MHIPDTPIWSYHTHEQHFQTALTLLKAKVAKYMKRSDDDSKLYAPRDEVNRFIFETIIEQEQAMQEAEQFVSVAGYRNGSQRLSVARAAAHTARRAFREVA